MDGLLTSNVTQAGFFFSFLLSLIFTINTLNFQNNLSNFFFFKFYYCSFYYYLYYLKKIINFFLFYSSSISLSDRFNSFFFVLFKIIF
jgi:hypothetical protein